MVLEWICFETLKSLIFSPHPLSPYDFVFVLSFWKKAAINNITQIQLLYSVQPQPPVHPYPRLSQSCSPIRTISHPPFHLELWFTWISFRGFITVVHVALHSCRSTHKSKSLCPDCGYLVLPSSTTFLGYPISGAHLKELRVLLSVGLLHQKLYLAFWGLSSASFGGWHVSDVVKMLFNTASDVW